MKLIIYIFCLFCSLQVLCQEKWHNKINSFKLNNGVVLQKADSNGWFVAANTRSFTLGETKNEIVLMRYGKCGKIRWSYRYGVDTNSIVIADMLTDNDNNIVLAGTYTLQPDHLYNGRSFMMKLSPNGDVIWARIFNLWGADYVYSIGQTNDGNYFIFSNHDNMGGALPYNTVTKVNLAGNLVWYRHIADNPIWGSAIKTSDGGILVRSGNLIYKLNVDGSVLWANSYSNIRYTCKPIEINNQYIFASYPSSADSVCYLFSLSPNGNLNWISPSFKSSSIKALKRLSNGNLLATGSIKITPSLPSRACLTEFSINGAIIQQQTIDVSLQQLDIYDYDFIELDNQSLIYAAIEYFGTNNDSLTLIKSRRLTDFSCTQATGITPMPQQQINVTSYPLNSFDIPNQEQTPSITKNSINIEMTMSCFVPDSNNIDLGNDTILCQHQNLVLNTGLGTAYEYLWSTGATTSSITINQAGTYWVKAYICDTIYDTIVVDYVTPLTLNYTISPLITDPYTLVSFENFTQPYSQLIWQTGDGHTYTSDIFQHQYLNGGIYYPLLTITDNYGCVYSSQTKVIVDEVTFYIPNSFTPNGDGYNDVFAPKCTGVERYEMFIYNRWGEEIFTAVNQGWDGKLKRNKEATQGVYNYKIIIKNIFGIKSIKSGAITLFR